MIEPRLTVGAAVVKATLRSNVLTILLFAAFVVALFLTHGFTGPTLAQRTQIGTGFSQVVLNGRWWTPITSVFVSDGGAQVIFVLLGIIVLIGISERVMGAARTLLAFVATSIVGAVVGITAQAVG